MTAEELARRCDRINDAGWDLNVFPEAAAAISDSAAMLRTQAARIAELEAKIAACPACQELVLIDFLKTPQSTESGEP